jgi:hypothetical protein
VALNQCLAFKPCEAATKFIHSRLPHCNNGGGIGSSEALNQGGMMGKVPP